MAKKIYKINLLGDYAVGKTSIRKRYMGEGFKEDYFSTIGADISVKRYDDYNVNIWDIPGQQSFNIVRSNYYVGTHGAILVFDIANRESMDNLQLWLDEILKSSFIGDIPFVIVGNKIDLRDGTENTVSEQEATEFVKGLSLWTSYEILYIEVSAKTGINVDLIFNHIMDQVRLSFDR